MYFTFFSGNKELTSSVLFCYTSLLPRLLFVLALQSVGATTEQAEHYPPPLYALEWITTVFGLAAQPLISLVALDLFLAGARNPVLRLCVSLLGGMDKGLLSLDQEGLLKELRSRAVEVDAQEVSLVF